MECSVWMGSECLSATPDWWIVCATRFILDTILIFYSLTGYKSRYISSLTYSLLKSSIKIITNQLELISLFIVIFLLQSYKDDHLPEYFPILLYLRGQLLIRSMNISSSLISPIYDCLIYYYKYPYKYWFQSVKTIFLNIYRKYSRNITCLNCQSDSCC